MVKGRVTNIFEKAVDFDNILRVCKNTGPIGVDDYLLNQS